MASGTNGRSISKSEKITPTKSNKWIHLNGTNSFNKEIAKVEEITIRSAIGDWRDKSLIIYNLCNINSIIEPCELQYTPYFRRPHYTRSPQLRGFSVTDLSSQN